MQKLGIIGTNWITNQFVDASKKSKSFELTHVYSRTKSKAEDFIDNIQSENKTIAISTNLDEFFSSTDFDTVYIASPNSLHFEQSKMAIVSGKNVIVEKPAYSNIDEFEKIENLLQNRNQFYFEAARHIHEDGFRIVKNYVDNNKNHLSGATLSYMKYSSRFDQVLAGEEPNIFSPKFSGGALYDLGVYTIYDAVVWFGKPLSVNYQPEMLKTGVDGSGVATLKYSKFDVNIIFGKTKNSFMNSEIYFGKNTLLIDNAGTIRELSSIENDNKEKIKLSYESNPMIDEARVFSNIIKEQDIEKYKQLFSYSKSVNEILYKLRKDAGIVFSADRV